MHNGAHHGIEDFVEDPFVGQHRADRHVSTLWQAALYRVRYPSAPAGPAKPSLDFIGDEQAHVFAAELQRSSQIAFVRKEDAFSLNRLDEESCYAARSQHLLQRSKIVERDLDAVSHKRTEARAEILIAIQ